MTIRNHATMAALIAALIACQPAPAHADAFPGQLPPDPARPGWRPPATRPHQPAAGTAYDFDPGRGPLLDPHAEDRIWLDPWGSWGPGTAAIPLPDPAPVVTPCRPPAAVPGPLPALGLGAAFAYSRKLRRRIR